MKIIHIRKFKVQINGNRFIRDSIAIIKLWFIDRQLKWLVKHKYIIKEE